MIALSSGFITVASKLFANGWPGGILICSISCLEVKFSIFKSKGDHCLFSDGEDFQNHVSSRTGITDLTLVDLTTFASG